MHCSLIELIITKKMIAKVLKQHFFDFKIITKNVNLIDLKNLDMNTNLQK